MIKRELADGRRIHVCDDCSGEIRRTANMRFIGGERDGEEVRERECKMCNKPYHHSYLHYEDKPYIEWPRPPVWNNTQEWEDFKYEMHVCEPCGHTWGNSIHYNPHDMTRDLIRLGECPDCGGQFASSYKWERAAW